MIRRTLKALGALIGLALLSSLVFFWWASSGRGDDSPVAPAAVEVLGEYAAEAGDLPTPAELTIVSFNIGYGRGPEGDYSGPWSAAHIRRNLDGIAAQIKASGADLAALQEVDLDAARSHGIHEGRYLCESLGWAYMSCVTTWQNNYVPFPYWPPSRHYGRMRSGQCLLSRYPILSATRYRLPQPEASPFWRNLFYLHRAIERVTLRLGERTLVVFNVHLEAFDEINRGRHIERLRELVDAEPSELLIVAGDFNAPPPEAEKRRGFSDEPEADFSSDDTITNARAMRDVSEAKPASDAFTFPAEAPTRRLDYIFHRRALSLASVRVLSERPVWSDHLPLLARFTLRP